MFKKILVPTDGSELSTKAIRGAIDYAKLAGASLVGVSVVDTFSSAALSDLYSVANATLQQYARDFAEKNLASFTLQASQAGIQYETDLPVNANPWSAIVETAKKRGCDAIFMASHGRRGVDAFLLGSETQKVLTHSPVPVLVYR